MNKPPGRGKEVGIDYNGVTFLVELLEWVAHFRDFWNEKILVKQEFKNRKIRIEFRSRNHSLNILMLKPLAQ